MKAQVGRDYLLVWQAPEPVTVAPTCTVRLPGGDVTPILAVVRAPVAVDGISTDRRILTATGAVGDAIGLQGRWGDAYLVTAEDGWYPVRVTRVDGTVIHLAEPLKRPVSLTGAASLIWASWTATLATPAVTGAIARGVPVVVRWAPAVGADVPAEPRTWRRLLDIVPQPFDTGLTHAELVREVPALARLGSDRQGSFDEQIESSLAQLALHVRRMAPVSLTEDDVDGAALLQVHVHLAAAAIYAGNGDTNQAEWHEARALGERNPATFRRETHDGLLHLALSKVWIDRDQSGKPEPGEISDLAGPTWPDAGNFSTSDTRTFGIGDRW